MAYVDAGFDFAFQKRAKPSQEAGTPKLPFATYRSREAVARDPPAVENLRRQRGGSFGRSASCTKSVPTTSFSSGAQLPLLGPSCVLIC
jgi:hypothetical protein